MGAEKDIWQTDYYAYPRIYMKLTGIWPYQSIREKVFFFVPMFTLSFSIFIPQTSYLIGSTDINGVFDSIPSLLITIIFSFKLAQALRSNDKMRTCIEVMQKDWQTLRSDIENTTLRRSSEHVRFLTKLYSIYLLTTVFVFMLKPFIMTLLEDDSMNVTTKSSIKGESKLPYHVEYGEKFNQYLYPIMFHCYLALFAHVIITIAVDTFYFALIQHACGMFIIIGHVLENIGKENMLNFYFRLDKIKDHNYIELLECLRRHLHVIEFAEQIESTYSSIFLISINLNMLVASICGIQVIMNLDNAGDVAAPLSLYIASIIHLFVQFWQAQDLMDHSIIPYDSINIVSMNLALCYSGRGSWYSTSKRCQKLFLLILNRSILPCKITAGNILVLSIEAFGMVLKTSMSFLTVFRSFQ